MASKKKVEVNKIKWDGIDVDGDKVHGECEVEVVGEYTNHLRVKAPNDTYFNIKR